MLIKNIPCAPVYYTADFLTTLLKNTYHFFFDGKFLNPYELYVNRLLFLLLIAASPVCIWSASRFFISGWEHLYVLHLAFIPILAITYFGAFSFAIKATVVIMIFNAVRTGQPAYLLHVGAWQWRFSDCNHFLLAFFRRALCDPEYGDRHLGRIILLFGFWNSPCGSS